MKIDKITLELTEEELDVLCALTEHEQQSKYWDETNAGGAQLIKLADEIHTKINNIRRAAL